MPQPHKPSRPRKSHVAQNEVLSRTLARQSKSQIAREMGIDRETVTRIQECHNLPQLLADSRRFIVENVAPDAIRSMHAQIVDRSAPGDLAARLLEKIGVLDGGSAPTHNIADGPSMQVLNALFPARPAAAATVSVKIETGSAPAITVEPVATENNS
jgi:hypothetical protein